MRSTLLCSSIVAIAISALGCAVWFHFHPEHNHHHSSTILISSPIPITHREALIEAGRQVKETMEARYPDLKTEHNEAGRLTLLGRHLAEKDLEISRLQEENARLRSATNSVGAFAHK